MPLPKLETPTYVTVLPIAKTEVEFRPFLVREEKILLIAQESSNNRDIIRSVLRVLRACTFEKIVVEDLCMCDFEYLFLQIRSKSVGETSKVKLKCEKDDHYTAVEISLSDVDITLTDNESDALSIIKLNDDVSIKLQPLRVAAAVKLDENNKADSLTEMIRASTEYVFDANNTYSLDNVSKKEFEEFVSSMSHQNLEAIQKYIDNQPFVSKTVEFTCEKCGHKNSIVLKGIASFFE